jgi:hypothetical protein
MKVTCRKKKEKKKKKIVACVWGGRQDKTLFWWWWLSEICTPLQRVSVYFWEGRERNLGRR